MYLDYFVTAIWSIGTFLAEAATHRLFSKVLPYQLSELQDFEPLKVAVAQICANRAHVQLALDQPQLALEDCQRALKAAMMQHATSKLPMHHAIGTSQIGRPRGKNTSSKACLAVDD